MDPQLKSRFPAKAARTVADIAQRCLQKDPSERPTMRTVVEHLKLIQDLKFSYRFPLQEPAAAPNSGKHMSKSPSMNGITVMPTPRLSFSPSPPSTRARPPSVSPTRRPLGSLPPRACSTSTVPLEEFDRQESRKSSSSSTVRRTSVEGF